MNNSVTTITKEFKEVVNNSLDQVFNSGIALGLTEEEVTQVLLEEFKEYCVEEYFNCCEDDSFTYYPFYESGG